MLSENKTVEPATESPAAKKYFVTCKQQRKKIDSYLTFFIYEYFL